MDTKVFVELKERGSANCRPILANLTLFPLAI